MNYNIFNRQDLQSNSRLLEEYKISPNDLKILAELISDHDVLKLLKTCRDSSYSLTDLVSIFYSVKNPQKKQNVTFVSSEEYRKILQHNRVFRATFGQGFGIKNLMESSMLNCSGANGVGLYATYGNLKYIVSHLQKFDTSDSSDGHILQTALNPTARVMDKLSLFKAKNKVVEALKTGKYRDNTELEFDGDPKVLSDFLSCDASMIAILAGADVVWMPVSNHLILLDKSSIVIPNEGFESQCDLRVNINNIIEEEKNEMARIKKFTLDEGEM